MPIDSYAAWEKLIASLSAEQRTELTRRGHFTVTSNLGHVFQIDAHGYSGNITGCGRLWCCHLPYPAPLGEHLLAQALAIRTDERAFLRTACAI